MYGSYGTSFRVRDLRTKEEGQGICYVVPDKEGAERWLVFLPGDGLIPAVVRSRDALVKTSAGQWKKEKV